MVVGDVRRWSGASAEADGNVERVARELGIVRCDLFIRHENVYIQMLKILPDQSDTFFITDRLRLGGRCPDAWKIAQPYR